METQDKPSKYLKNHLIELTEFKADPESMSILQHLQAAGFTHPMLYGGALRDDYLRKTQGLAVKTGDYDIKCAVDIEKVLGGAATSADASDKLKSYLATAFPQSEIISAKVHIQNGELQYGHFDLIDREAHRLETSFENKQSLLPMQERMFGNAPINMIAMNVEGRVLADFLFPDHAAERIYKPYDASEHYTASIHSVVDYRFESLLKKIPGLRFQETSQLDGTLPHGEHLTHNPPVMLVQETKLGNSIDVKQARSKKIEFYKRFMKSENPKDPGIA